MHSFKLNGIRKVLCIGAHADDIEIGCGGTLLRIIQENPNVEVYWVVFSANTVRNTEASNSADCFLTNASQSVVELKSFKESFFPDQWAGIKETLNAIGKSFEPDLVFTHYRDDRHQDHRVLSDLTWNTFRDHLILEYEIPKYDGDLGQPNVFVSLTTDVCERKVGAVMKHFKSQQDKPWFTADTFWAMLRLRGVECASPTNYAEAFHGRKLCF